MARIKVTGYMWTDDLEPQHVDLSDDMGLSEVGYLYYIEHLGLDDLDFELVDE